MNIIPQTVIDALNNLAGQSDIAAFLYAEGVRVSETTRDRQRFSCPVAQYLYRRTGAEDGELETYCTFTAIKFSICVNHPTPVKEFIEDFDEGKYPQFGTWRVV